MNSIKWDPFNRDTEAVVNSNSVSFYKGVPVFLKNTRDRSSSFWVISLDVSDKNEAKITTDHERGHNSQLMMMGLGTFGLTIAIESIGGKSDLSSEERFSGYKRQDFKLFQMIIFFAKVLLNLHYK